MEHEKFGPMVEVPSAWLDEWREITEAWHEETRRFFEIHAKRTTGEPPTEEEEQYLADRAERIRRAEEERRREAPQVHEVIAMLQALPQGLPVEVWGDEAAWLSDVRVEGDRVVIE